MEQWVKWTVFQTILIYFVYFCLYEYVCVCVCVCFAEKESLTGLEWHESK